MRKIEHNTNLYLNEEDREVLVRGRKNEKV